jgi:hypothetical protein
MSLLILVAILFAAERWRLVASSTIDETSLGKVSNGLLALVVTVWVFVGVSRLTERLAVHGRGMRRRGHHPRHRWSARSLRQRKIV